MDPDVMLCTTAFVKAETCIDDYMETAVLTTKTPQNKDYYNPEKGRDTTDADREGWVGIAAAAAPVVAAGDANSIVNMCKSCECVVCACVSHNNGELNLGFGNKLLLFWVILGTTIGINIVFEILVLMYVAMRYAVKVACREQQIGIQGAHLNPLGIFLEPPGPFLTHLHTVYMAYSEHLPTRLTPLAERTCFSQVAWALDIRLLPLNADRAFVADSLVRAAFELGVPYNCAEHSHVHVHLYRLCSRVGFCCVGSVACFKPGQTARLIISCLLQVTQKVSCWASIHTLRLGGHSRKVSCSFCTRARSCITPRDWDTHKLFRGPKKKKIFSMENCDVNIEFGAHVTFLGSESRAQVVFTGLAIKFLVGRTTEPEFGLWWKPWLGMVTATIAWDALIAHCIVMQAQVRGIGVFTSCELFNEIMELYKSVEEISDDERIQITRGIGVSIVKSGCMYPTMELMLRHAIQYLELRGKSRRGRCCHYAIPAIFCTHVQGNPYE
jgi:hypothetical protein